MPACPPLPPVIGHRGAAAHAPENTLASLRMAKRLGCAWVEFDVRLTADAAPVLCHDPGLARTTGRPAPISALTLGEVRQSDAGRGFGEGFRGERVPMLEEALLLAAELGLGANIEVKAESGRDYATAAVIADCLGRLRGRLPAVLVSSFRSGALETMRALAAEVPRGMLFRRVPSDWAAVASRLGCSVIGADHRHLTRRRAAEIRAAGYQLAAYTVNDPARACLLFEWGVTSVFSDAPDIILRGAGAVPAPILAEAAPPLARQGANR